MTAYAVSGTQAATGKQNHLIVMKMSDLHSTISEEDSKWSDTVITGSSYMYDHYMYHKAGEVEKS